MTWEDLHMWWFSVVAGTPAQSRRPRSAGLHEAGAVGGGAGIRLIGGVVVATTSDSPRPQRRLTDSTASSVTSRGASCRELAVQTPRP